MADHPPLPLQALLLRLRAAGLDISPMTWVEVNRVLETLAPVTPFDRLPYLIAPLVTRTPAEQTLFHQLFQDYITPSSAQPDPSARVLPVSDPVYTSPPAATTGPVSRLLDTTLQNGWFWLGIVGIVGVFIWQTGFSWWIVLGGFVPAMIMLGISPWLNRITGRKPPPLPGPYVWQPSPPLVAADLFTLDERQWLAHPFRPGLVYGYDRSRLRVADTLQATLRQGGQVNLVFEPVGGASGYVFLIDKTVQHQHHSAWLEQLAATLTGQGVSVETLTYEGDLRLLTDVSGAYLNLDQLDERRRLMVFGDGRTLVDPISGTVFPWAAAILARWQARALLSPVPPRTWGPSEAILSEWLVLVPATFEGLSAALAALDGRTYTDWEDWREQPEDYVWSTPTVAGLRRELPLLAYQWLAACAIYPETYWSLTLWLGQRLEALTGSPVLTREYLSLLTRIQWLRAGTLPDEARLALLEDLPDDLEGLLRQDIAALVQAGAEHLPVASYAAKRQRIFLLINQLGFETTLRGQWDLMREIHALGEILGPVQEPFLQTELYRLTGTYEAVWKSVARLNGLLPILRPWVENILFRALEGRIAGQKLVGRFVKPETPPVRLTPEAPLNITPEVPNNRPEQTQTQAQVQRPVSYAQSSEAPVSQAPEAVLLTPGSRIEGQGRQAEEGRLYFGLTNDWTGYVSLDMVRVAFQEALLRTHAQGNPLSLIVLGADPETRTALVVPEEIVASDVHEIWGDFLVEDWELDSSLTLQIRYVAQAVYAARQSRSRARTEIGWQADTPEGRAGILITGPVRLIYRLPFVQAVAVSVADAGIQYLSRMNRQEVNEFFAMPTIPEVDWVPQLVYRYVQNPEGREKVFSRFVEVRRRDSEDTAA
ncbi:MAG: hypothetical protein SF053_01510 [Bacteroidia bacterium]|nr:hypothetical protein [Bacteroidia bacterium]